MVRRRREASFCSLLFVLGSVLAGLYVASPAFGGGRNIVLPQRFGAEEPLVEALRDVLRRIETASRDGDEQAIVRSISVEYAAELRTALRTLGLGDGRASLQGIGIGPRLLDDIRFGVARGDVIVLVQDLDNQLHRIWRFVWTGYVFVLDAMEFHPWMSSQVALRELADRWLADRSK